MRRVVVCLLVVLVGCATGSAADDTVGVDSGSKVDSSTKTDSGTPKTDSGTPKQDSGGPQPDSGGGNCGGQCLGLASTCCNNVCVDITGDSNNCGGCGNPCGSLSCCAGNCTDTMGSDTSNCGGCGVPCSGTCMNGVCQTQGGGCTISKGSCSHSPCTTGSALPAGCDANDEDLTDAVCLIFDPSCCTSSWTSTCVTYAAFFETNSCQGGGC
jgi:hypothetical protein